MTLQLYNIWLQDGATETAEDEIRADIQQAGFVGQGGTASERVSAESIDLTVTGQFRLGDILSRKFAVELDSLGASAYDAVPLYDTETTDRKRKYYHVERAETSPAHQTTDGTFEYTVALSEAGTRSEVWRAVRTNHEDVTTDLASGTTPFLRVDSRATKERWFTPSSGTDSASGADTQTGADGASGTDKYDPDEVPWTDPILIYELDFDAERSTDVVLYDDRGFDDKEVEFVSGESSTQATRWHHVFHAAHEFDGRPVVDTGRLRVRFDGANDQLEAFQESSGSYSQTSLDQSDYDLFDADVTEIKPADVRVFAEFEKTDGTIDAAVLSFQRGFDEVLVRSPPGASNVANDLEDLLRPIALDWAEDPAPEQDVIRRNEVSGQ